MAMRPDEDVHEVFRLSEQGFSKAEISRRVGISRATVRDWLIHGKEAVLARPMRVAAEPKEPCGGRCDLMADIDEVKYAYLLGQYLGDGCISRIGSGYRLRVSCCNAYPNIMAECDLAIRAVSGTEVRYIPRKGCTEVYATWFHWPCLLPHGEGGVKHLRSIRLTPRQRRIAIDRHPGLFVRGLIHSDGWRGTNHVRGANGRPYAYTRYQFSNRSAEIKNLFTEACDRLGVESRRMNEYNISVAKRDSVALLDRIVGPKS